MHQSNEVDENCPEFVLVEQHERERRQWLDERKQLVQCVKLQQLELQQRAIAAQETATNIAKDFMQTIANFEDRLFTVENNVNKEILSIKAIAESLKASLPDETVANRVISLERKIDEMIATFNKVTAI